MSLFSLTKSLGFLFSILVFSLSLAYLTLAWTEPSSSPPPAGNASTPLNVSSTSQTKAGSLTVGGTTGITAPIFYDSDNSAYYISPAGPTSVFSGNVGIGTTNPEARLHIVGNSDTDLVSNNIIMEDQGTDPDDSANLHGRRSRGGLGVQDGDELFEIDGIGYVNNAHGYKWASIISMYVDGAVNTTNGIVPGSIRFYTTPPTGAGNTVQRMVIKSNGNIGIGTSSPEEALHIARSGSRTEILIESASNDQYANAVLLGRRARGTLSALSPVALDDNLWEVIGLGYDGNSYDQSARILMNVDGAVSDGKVPGRIEFAVSDANGNLIFPMTIKSSGNVGIGTSSPSAVLDILGSTSRETDLKLQSQNGWDSEINLRTNTHRYTIGNYGTQSGVSLQDKFYITDSTAGANRLVIDTVGNVGIGTTTPQGALDVVSTTGALIVPRMTTIQRDALTSVNGMIIYNASTNQFNFRENGAWVTK